MSRDAALLAGVTFGAETPRHVARSRLADALRRAGVESADLDARLLVCAACDIGHLALVCEPDRALGPDPASDLDAFARRRLAREPVSRILGKREFWGLPFAIDPHVLDPRPDTESLVGTVLDALGDRRDAPLRLLDLGTGSGAILAALLHELPAAVGLGIDRSQGACIVAAANLRALGLETRASIVCGSWSDAVVGRFDAIVSNPPYIPSRELANLEAEVRDHDPRGALDGGADGLDAYRTLLQSLGSKLAPGGVCAVECGHTQGEAVAALLGEAGLSGVMIERDLAGRQRIVMGRRDGAEGALRSAARKTLGERIKNA